jgi:LuxR family transcriptional regulator, maltose regulon positive regulatory protein
MTPAPPATAAPLREGSEHAGRRLRDVSATPAAALPPGRRRPAFRPGLVARARLVRRLAGAGDVPLVLAVAPPGYGKTTALSEWAEQDPRPFAWVALEPADDDPAVLVGTIAIALEEVEPVGHDVFAALRAGGPDGTTAALAALGAALAGRRRPFVLVLDDAHALRSDGARDVLTTLVASVPPGSQLALASRTEPPLPVGRLRAHRRVVEVGPRELQMTRAEAAELLGGVGLRPADVELLVDRTEGWPAGLYLAALSLRDEPDRDRAVARFAGDDRLVADYLRDEVLAGLPRERLSFLTRTSVLDALSGPLCDAVLARPGSGGTLRDLARSNLMLVPLDRAEDRYRYHGLFAEMLQAELRRIEPEVEAEVHRRASAWHAGRGETDRAIHHAIAGGETAAAADLLWGIAAGWVTGGRDGIVRRWLDRFAPEEIARHPRLALTAAVSDVAAGDRDRAEHWVAAASRGLAPDGVAAGSAAGAASTERAVADLLRAVAARDGLARMGEDAAALGPRLVGETPWLAVRGLLEGTARYLTGDREAARAPLEDGARHGAVAAPLVQVLCLAQLGVLALEEDDAETAEVCISRARRQVERVGLSDCPLAALVFAASALGRAQRGRVDEAHLDMREGARLLSELADFTPWYEVETRLLLARAALRLSDIVGARTLLAEASRLARRTPDAVVLTAWLEEAWAQADSFASAAILGPTSLTTAELRVLRLLPTHLSFREIAGRLHVSANTIKTQAHAVYRKLDASSRTEAVASARRLGLVDV